jgi:hypothetical protein
MQVNFNIQKNILSKIIITIKIIAINETIILNKKCLIISIT